MMDPNPPSLLRWSESFCFFGSIVPQVVMSMSVLSSAACGKLVLMLALDFLILRMLSKNFGQCLLKSQEFVSELLMSFRTSTTVQERGCSVAKDLYLNRYGLACRRS